MLSAIETEVSLVCDEPVCQFLEERIDKVSQQENLSKFCTSNLWKASFQKVVKSVMPTVLYLLKRGVLRMRRTSDRRDRKNYFENDTKSLTSSRGKFIYVTGHNL